MKKIIFVLCFASVIMIGVLIFLVQNGISLRSAPIIRPSLMTSDQTNVAHSIVLRLFPDFQTSDYVVIGLDPQSAKTMTLVQLLKNEYEQVFKKTVSFLSDSPTLTTEEFSKCSPPCWFLTTQDKANELTQKLPLARFHHKESERSSFNLTLLQFQRDLEVPPPCVEEKRLSFECLIPLSVHEARRRMTDPSGRYFFVRKYNERDYFIFMEK